MKYEHYDQPTSEEQQLIQEANAMVAGKLHDQWRNTFQHPHEEDGKTVYDPRVKVLVRMVSGQEDWFNEGKQPEGSVELRRQDIANTPYAELDEHWQDENKHAAEVAVDVMRTDGGSLDLTDQNQRDYAGDRIHRAWMARNPKYAEESGLDVSFVDLPEVEQQKDIDHAVIAQGVLQELGYPQA